MTELSKTNIPYIPNAALTPICTNTKDTKRFPIGILLSFIKLINAITFPICFNGIFWLKMVTEEIVI